MTSLVTADEKGRLCVRGTKRGHKYLVKQEQEGWWITPVPEVLPSRPVSRNRREWVGSKRTLLDVLREMGEAGLRIEPAENAKQPVPPCRV